MQEILPKIDNLFDFLSVHQEMLSDNVRLKAYDQAIKNVVKPGDVVVDVGTGTGILAILCAKAGARKVYAIECRPIINLAKQIAKENGFEDRIVFIKGDSRSITLPEKVDVLVSEVIGHTVLEENMLDSIVDAKSRFLKQKGSMLPVSAKLMFAPTYNSSAAKDLNFWRKKLLGISLRPAWNRVTNTVYISRIKPENLLGESEVLREINFGQNHHINLKGRMNFKITREGEFHGFAAWFEALLAKKGKVKVKTSPFDPSTHWKTAFFPVGNPMGVYPGDEISLNLSCYSTGTSTIWEWRGNIKSHDADVKTFSHSSELY